ncbi:hypothetical protein Vretifemale_1865 [Volvox reticuliferus]|nr:hypothetical protein Vretifemale_1865 [Volvox reticuliferus]
MEGFAPIIGSAAGITTSPCPGLTLAWDATTGVITTTLPDGGAVTAAPYTAAFVPPGVLMPPLDMLAAAPEHEHEELEDDDDERGEKNPKPADGLRDALATAELLSRLCTSPDINNVFLFDPRGGSCAFFESPSLRFLLLGPAARTAVVAASAAADNAAGGADGGGATATAGPPLEQGSNVQLAPTALGPQPPRSYWPPPEPLLNVHIPELPPVPPPPPPPPEQEDSSASSVRREGSNSTYGRRSTNADGASPANRTRVKTPVEVDDDDDDKPPPPPRPPTPPTPEPIITYQPVAVSIKPRIFVLRSDGTGFEVLDTDVVQSYLAGRRMLATEAAGTAFSAGPSGRPGSASAIPLPGVAGGLAVDIWLEEVEGADEEGTVVHSVLVQVPQRPASLEPLPVGGATLLQRYNPHAEELMPAFKRLSQLLKPPPGAGLSSVQYLPRILAYEPPSVRQPPPLPILIYRELLELPQLSSETVSNIREVLAQQAHAELVCYRFFWQGGCVADAAGNGRPYP